jgi:hypothetical protein
MAPQGEAQVFEVKAVPNAPEGTDFGAVASFQQETSELSRQISGAVSGLRESAERLRYMKAALLNTPGASQELFAGWEQLQVKHAGLQQRLTWDPVLGQKNEASEPSIAGRVGQVIYGHWDTRQAPTQTQVRNVEIARSDFEQFRSDLRTYLNEVEAYEGDLEKAGAPWTRGRKF